MPSERRRLRIVGVKIFEIRGCRECPLFDDGASWEYHSECKLTGQDGSSIYEDDCDDVTMILSKCPLPKAVE